jgi:hypothetical protein
VVSRDNPCAFPRLRLDKVALRLVQEVRSSLGGAVPDSLCVVFAVTAPIREPSKTTSAVIETIRAKLAREAVLGEQVEHPHGNEVRVRVVTSRSPYAVRVAGFVHNPDPPPGGLLDLAQSLLECVETPGLARNVSTAPTLKMLRLMCEQVLDPEGCAVVFATLRMQPL